jgi:hypothetical protein
MNNKEQMVQMPVSVLESILNHLNKSPFEILNTKHSEITNLVNMIHITVVHIPKTKKEDKK